MRIRGLFKAILIEGRVESIEILGIQLIRRKAHTLTEPLEMDYLPCAQEFDRVADIGIVDKPQDIVVRLSRLLLRRKILGKVAYSVARALDISGSERHSRGRGGVNTGGVVNEICVEARALYLILGEISRELIDYRADHFEMPKFVRPNKLSVIKRVKKARGLYPHAFLLDLERPSISGIGFGSRTSISDRSQSSASHILSKCSRFMRSDSSL